MQKKYSITKESKIVFGIKLFRIKAKISFGSVKKGELGGWIEKEKNLNQNNNAWVFDNALVFGNARVSGSARVSDNAWVSDNAEVSGNAWVFGELKLKSGWCFATIRKDWKVSEIKNGDETLS